MQKFQKSICFLNYIFNERSSNTYFVKAGGHGHLGSNQMLKNVEFFSQKNGNVKKKYSFSL